MGLFNLFKHNDNAKNIKPLEEYLRQRHVVDLVMYGKRCLQPIISNRGMWISPSQPVKYFTPNFMTGKYDSGAEPIPKCYKNDEVSAKTFFEIAMEKGYSEAAFYLGIMYEYGISVEFDIGLAKEYYEKASKMPNSDGSESEGQILTKMRNYFRENTNNNETFTPLRQEWMAFCMHISNGEKFEDYPTVCNLAGGNERIMEEFATLGFKLLCHYAIEGLPLSICTVACAMMDFDNNLSDRYDRIIKDATGSIHSIEDIKKCGNVLIVQCQEKARGGNAYAIKILNQYQIPY